MSDLTVGRCKPLVQYEILMQVLQRRFFSVSLGPKSTSGLDKSFGKSCIGLALSPSPRLLFEVQKNRVALPQEQVVPTSGMLHADSCAACAAPYQKWKV